MSSRIHQGAGQYSHQEEAFVGGVDGAVVSDAGDGVLLAGLVDGVGVVEGGAHEVVWFLGSNVVATIAVAHGKVVEGILIRIPIQILDGIEGHGGNVIHVVIVPSVEP